MHSDKYKSNGIHTEEIKDQQSVISSLKDPFIHFGEGVKKLNRQQQHNNASESSSNIDLNDLRASQNHSIDRVLFGSPRINITPRQHQHTAEYDGFSQYDSEYQKKKLQRKHEDEKSHFCKNRIVELCYGQNGLIEFLDLLFTQFPQKSAVKQKFNYYFAIRKQLQDIENQIQSTL